MFKPFKENAHPKTEKVIRNVKSFYKKFISSCPELSKPPVFEVKDGFIFYSSPDTQTEFSLNAISLVGTKIAKQLHKEGKIKFTLDGGILTENNEFILEPVPKPSIKLSKKELKKFDISSYGGFRSSRWPYIPFKEKDKKD